MGRSKARRERDRILQKKQKAIAEEALRATKKKETRNG